MPLVFKAMSISLDGYAAGPDDGPAHPLGVGGERLHDWMKAATNTVDGQLVREPFERAGAAVIGRRMFDLGRMHWGGNAFNRLPLFVVTSRPPDPGDEGWAPSSRMVTPPLSPEPVPRRAAATSGCSGGADLVRRCLADGLLDELGLTLVPKLLGAGTRLLDGLPSDGVRFTPARVLEGVAVTHHRYQIRHGNPVGKPF